MITISNFKPTNATQGCKLATFDVHVQTPTNNFHIRNMALLKKNERSWVNPPQYCTEAPDGKKTFHALFELGDADAQKALLNAISKEAQKQPLTPQPEPTINEGNNQSVPF